MAAEVEEGAVRRAGSMLCCGVPRSKEQLYASGGWFARQGGRYVSSQCRQRAAAALMPIQFDSREHVLPWEVTRSSCGLLQVRPTEADVTWRQLCSVWTCELYMSCSTHMSIVVFVLKLRDAPYALQLCQSWILLFSHQVSCPTSGTE